MNDNKFMLVDYSDKAIALAIERDGVLTDDLTNIGGRYNSRLKFGAGWIFSRKKSEAALLDLLAADEIDYCRVALSDIVSDHTTSAGATAPDYILTDAERKEWITATYADYIRKDAIKNIAVCVRLADGGILPIESRGLRTEFWFGESDCGQGPTADEASAAAHDASTKPDYFLNENLNEFRDILSGLKGEARDDYKYLYLYTCDNENGKEWKLKWSNLNPQSTNWVDFLERWERKLYDKGEYRPLTGDDCERLIAGYEHALALREKRCRAYLKRYGLSKIHASTYWMDR